jgi:hypothetical protein
MDKLAIKTTLELQKRFFIKLNILDLQYLSKKIDNNNIYDVELKTNLFKNLSNVYNEEKVHIFIAIINKSTNEVIDSRVYNRNIKKNKKVQFNIHNIKNTEPITNHEVFIAILQSSKNNRKQLKELSKSFYKPMNLFENKSVIKNKSQVITTLVLVSSIFFTFLQVSINHELINNYGFVDSIIKDLSIANSIVQYFYTFIKQTDSFLVIYFLSISIFFIPSIINVISDLFTYVFRIIFFKKSDMINFHLQNSLRNVVYNFKEVVNISFLFRSILIYFLFMISIFIPISIVISENNERNHLNYKYKIIKNYLSLSVFPEFVSIQKDELKKDILIIGYDETYTYYYNIDYIGELLKKHLSPIKNIEEDNRKKIPLNDVYAFYLNNISKDKIKYMRNNEYKVIKRIKTNYSLQNNKSIVD